MAWRPSLLEPGELARNTPVASGGDRYDEP